MIPPEHIEFLTSNALSAPPGYSHVVRVHGGQTIYVSGQIALDAQGNLVGAGDFRAQAEQVFTNLQAALAAADADFHHVVKLNLYVLDRSNLSILREVRERYINTAFPPTSTLVQVSSLAREDFLLEVEAIASLPALAEKG